MPEKKKATPYTGLTRTPQSGQWDPFAPPDTFQAVPGELPPAYTGRAPSNVTGGTEYTALAANSTVSSAGIPQSYVDGIADLLQRDRAAGNTHTSFNGIQDRSRFVEREPGAQMSQQEFDTYVQATWQAAPPDQKQRYIQADQEAVAGINRTNLQNRAVEVALGAPELNRQQANKYWGSQVAPLEREDQAAYDRMVSGNRAREQEYSGYVGDYTNTIRTNEAARMAGIQSTNDEQRGYDQALMSETLAANQRNTEYGQQWTNAANQTNARQDQLFGDYRTAMQGYNQQQTQLASQNASTLNGISANQSALASQLSGDMRSYNAQQTGYYNQFAGDVSNANSIQNMNLGQFGRAVQGANLTANSNLAGLGARTGEYNQRQLTNLDDLLYDLDRYSGQQTDALNVYAQQLNQMNDADRAAYMQYLSETNPLMAERLAQGSNQEYVGNMEDVVSRYKAQSTPEVTGQERFTAELARRKFEADDRSSREAVMQQLAGRGLKSGGLVVANQQAQRQQLAQDRQLNELGLQAQAVARAERGLAGYEASSRDLRLADDSMRNFQDVYKQNEAVRTGNLAQQRNQQSLLTNNQLTNRDTARYDATTQTIRDNTDRSNLGYNARTETNQLNYGRDLNYYNASQDVNNQNYMRDRDYYGAATETNNLNYGRNQDLFYAGTTTVNNNAQRTYQAAEYGRATNNDNTARANDIFNNGTTALTNNTFRDSGVFDAGTRTNEGNYGRTTEAIGTNLGITQTNLGNFGFANREQSRGAGERDARYQGGLNSGNLGAGSILEAQGGSINQRTNNAASESATATVRAGSAAGRAQVQSGIQQQTTTAQQEALARALGFASLEEMRRAGGIA